MPLKSATPLLQSCSNPLIEQEPHCWIVRVWVHERKWVLVLMISINHNSTWTFRSPEVFNHERHCIKHNIGWEIITRSFCSVLLKSFYLNVLNLSSVLNMDALLSVDILIANWTDIDLWHATALRKPEQIMSLWGFWSLWSLYIILMNYGFVVMLKCITGRASFCFCVWFPEFSSSAFWELFADCFTSHTISTYLVYIFTVIYLFCLFVLFFWQENDLPEVFSQVELSPWASLRFQGSSNKFHLKPCTKSDSFRQGQEGTKTLTHLKQSCNATWAGFHFFNSCSARFKYLLEKQPKKKKKWLFYTSDQFHLISFQLFE